MNSVLCLKNKSVEAFLLNTYLEAIWDANGLVERSYISTKLVHTYQVVEIAGELIKRHQPSLSQTDQERILECALLHDIARTRQFKNGEFDVTGNHGHVGAEMIRKAFPKMEYAAMVTEYHNATPSEKDPADYQLYLDFVRDADMVANLYYLNIKEMYKRLKDIFPVKTVTDVDAEVIEAIQQKRAVCLRHIRENNFLNSLLSELNWKYNIRLPESHQFLREHSVLLKVRDAITNYIVPQIIEGVENQQRVSALIKKLYPDTWCEE